MMKTIIKKLRSSFFYLFYPSICLHCKNLMGQADFFLCNLCLEQMEFLRWQERCRSCFSDRDVLENLVCSSCFKKSFLHEEILVSFEYQGPAATLIQQLKYGNKPYLAKGCGAYMAMQLLESHLPIPDLIVPVPMMFTHWVARGYNQSALLAESLAELIKRPVVPALKRKSGAYSQAALTKKQRLLGQDGDITLKHASMLTDKVILLVDDVVTTGNTFRKCTEVLMEAAPSKVYLLAFCRAD